MKCVSQCEGAMNSERYTRSIVLLCPTCGNSDLEQAEGDDNQEAIHCPSCNRAMSRDELIRENGENVDAVVAEVTSEVLKDAEQELKNMLKNAFKGSPNIRIS